MSTNKRRTTHRSPTREDELVATGIGAVTLAYLQADFTGNQAEADRLTQTWGSNLLLKGVTTMLRVSIEQEERMQYLEQMAEALAPEPVPAGAAAFVRGQ